MVLAGAAVAQSSMGGMDHSQMSGGTMSGMTMKMDMSGLEKLQGKAFDRAFLSMMVPHHQMAVDMSKAVLPRSKDVTVKTWANAVIKDQNREINQMNTLLKSYGGSNAAMANMMKSSMSGHAEMVQLQPLAELVPAAREIGDLGGVAGERDGPVIGGA